tara:strand:+ start:2474 stop:3202 length:729 start_codon:yes stop_codon:yes gene_type:complete
MYPGPLITTEGLILTLDASSPRSYPGSGTAWNNLGDELYDATISGSPDVDTQNGISYLNFNSFSSKYAVLNNVFEVESLSIEFYVLPLTSATGTDTGRILSRDRSDYWMVGRAQSGYSVPNALEWTIRPGGSSMRKHYTSTAFFTDGEWVHGIVTYNGSDGVRNVYQNGTLFETITNAGSTSGNIGNGATRVIAVNNNVESAGAQGNLGMKGYYSLIRAYSIPLTAKQVKQNYNAVKSRFGL